MITRIYVDLSKKSVGWNSMCQNYTSACPKHSLLQNYVKFAILHCVHAQRHIMREIGPIGLMPHEEFNVISFRIFFPENLERGTSMYNKQYGRTWRMKYIIQITICIERKNSRKEEGI
jgi:hypothetical protein